MLSSISLSNESVNLLQLRGLSDEQVSDFSALLDKANSQLENDKSAKQVLSDMSQKEMKLLQKSTGLVDPISVSSLSREGAHNLLAQPDKTGMVDLNNDGIVEIGAGKMVTFPPVNAPASVHKSWEAATEGMSEGDKMIMQLHMHHAVYGFQIEGIESKEALAPEDQWSTNGWQQLLKELRSALEFAVALDGWDRTNLVRQDFYDKFEAELQQLS
ncbi:hypothetical protein ACMXYR_07150 [Neptuniibacter sp. QD29_5]|uniref:hypothetical protein n=1 Tax=Neptuniibacter sp. QD29_5 TaxID=3398207 RepID=UPI0039F5A1BE